jgi:hypothetical protein
MPKQILATVVLALAALMAACTPMPGTTLEDGGSYVVEVSIPSQEVTNEFPLPFGLGTCIAAVHTPEVAIPNTTVEVPPFEYEMGATHATIPGVTVELPRSRVSAGSFSVTCNGHELGRIGVSIEFEAVVEVRSATIELETSAVFLHDTTIDVTDAEATFAGAPAGTPPVQLDPFSVDIPEFEMWL